MSRPATRIVLKSLLKAVSVVSFSIAGLSFLFGDRAIREFYGVDFILAEMISIGIATACLVIGAVAKNKIEDVEWEEQNEEAEKHQEELNRNINDPH